MFVSKLVLKDYTPFSDLTIELDPYKPLVVLVGSTDLVNQGVLQAIWATQSNCIHSPVSKRDTQPCQITFNNGVTLRSYVEKGGVTQMFVKEGGQEHQLNIPKDQALPIFIYCNPCLDDLCGSQEREPVFNSVSDFYKSSDRYDRALDTNLELMLEQIEERLKQRGITATGSTFAEKLALIHSSATRGDGAADGAALTANDYPKYLHTLDSQNFSLGYKEFLSILMAIDIFDCGGDQHIFLMVEPFAHARTSERSEMMEFVSSYINPRCQLWITTNNSNFAQAIQQNMGQDSQIVKFDGKADWRNSAQRLKATPSL